MKKIDSLTEKRKEIHEHYMRQHRDLIESLTRTTVKMLQCNDRLGLLWLSQAVMGVFAAVTDRMPDDEKGFPTIGGMQ
ncbi:MAG: hypothetical protein JRH18_08945 [Deltaproteobacteria bacterium]|nr:hypothetical protein [Deltaproteobacteria bacterium]MBW2151780.1 hypothetical protein [Deltaproteobacteria bacterium]